CRAHHYLSQFNRVFLIFKGCGDSDPQATGSIPEASGTTSRAPAFLAVEEANDVEINARRLILVTNKAHQADLDDKQAFRAERKF
ncbi:MAG: hypothetical protein WCC54_14005, partial [Pseudolabrys sp.]